ncbi:restriction endonuclease subunit S [Vibrio cyclitrophicus]
MVPKGWELKKLEELATVERGKFSARPRNDPKYYGGDIPFVQTGDITAAKTYLSSFNQTLNEDGLKVSRLFPKNTILITIAANIGDTAITLFEVSCPDSLVGIQARKGVDCVWLNSYLETCKDELDGKATQNAQKNINLQVLKPLSVLTPPPEEQQKIAKILLTWDSAISTTDKLIANSKQQKKALMQQLLTGKKRLVNPETSEEFSGGWEEVHLGEVTQFIKDGTHGTHKRYEVGVPMLSAVNITKQHSISFDAAPKISETDYEKIHSKYQIEKGDILLTVVGTLGRVALVEVDTKFTLQRSVAIIRVSSRATNQFLKQLFSSISFNQLLHRKSNSTAQAGVYLGELAKIKLLLPSIEEQQKIATVLTAADKETELLEAKLAHLKQEKKSLMQQLLTGKRRVKIAA